MPLATRRNAFPGRAATPTAACTYFVAQDRRDLHRQQVFRLAQVGPDEDLKMPILAALIIPALAYAPAAPAA